MYCEIFRGAWIYRVDYIIFHTSAFSVPKPNFIIIGAVIFFFVKITPSFISNTFFFNWKLDFFFYFLLFFFQLLEKFNFKMISFITFEWSNQFTAFQRVIHTNKLRKKEEEECPMSPFELFNVNFLLMIESLNQYALSIWFLSSYDRQ